MRKLLCYLRDYKKETVLGPLFKLLEATLELFVPLVVAAIIDTGMANQDREYIVKMCLILVLLGGDRTCSFYYGTVFCGKGSSGICKKSTSCAVCPYTEIILCGN